MTDYTKLVEALRRCISDVICTEKVNCGYWSAELSCTDSLMADAAAAIEALQAEIKRLKEANDELREAQTYIDHYGDRWMTSAKDVPTSAYEHGYADGRDEAEAQLPKRGEWVHRDEFDYMDMNEVEHSHFMCNKCGFIHDFFDGHTSQYKYCPNCGAKMIGEQNVE